MLFCTDGNNVTINLLIKKQHPSFFEFLRENDNALPQAIRQEQIKQSKQRFRRSKHLPKETNWIS